MSSVTSIADVAVLLA